MYKRILCPIDGSLTSNLGLKEAISLAQNQGAQLRLMHVIDTYMPVVDGEGGLALVNLVEILQKNAEEVIQLAKKLAVTQGVEADAIVTEILGGSPATAIIAQSNSWPADIIVMGTHGLRGFSRLIMGSDAEQVVRTSSVPVMLINTSNTS